MGIDRRGFDPERGFQPRGGGRPQHGSASGDEGSRRPVRLGRADPAVCAAVGRGDEDAPSTHLERYLVRAEGVDQGQDGAGDGLRRRPRYRQESGQDDPGPTTDSPWSIWASRCRRRRSSTRRRRSRRMPSAFRRCWSPPAGRCRWWCRNWSAAERAPRCSSAARRSTAPSAAEFSSRRSISRTRAGSFYCKDAFEGLATMEKLRDPAAREDAIAPISSRRRKSAISPPAASARERSAVRRLAPTACRSPFRRSSARVCARAAAFRSVRMPRPRRTLPAVVGRKNAHGEEWEQLSRDSRAAGKNATRGVTRELAAAARCLWILPGAIRGRRPDRLRSGASGRARRASRALFLPAPAGCRSVSAWRIILRRSIPA